PTWNAIGSAGAAVKLNSIIAADNTNTINSANYAQAWNWNSLTTETAMTLASSSQTTGTVLNVTGSNNAVGSTGPVASFNVTGASNAATGVMITNAGTGNSLRINDDGTTTDATPVIVDAAGRVGIGVASPTAALAIGGAGAQTTTFTPGASDITISGPD